METANAPLKASDETLPLTRPVIVDLGKKTKKSIKNLKRGTGDTMLEVEAAIRHVRARFSDADKNKPVIPIVLIYERKRKRLSVPSLPFSPFNLLR
jgi:hypothetical protein